MDVLFVFSLGSVTNRCGINHSAPDSYEALLLLDLELDPKYFAIPQKVISRQ